MGAYLMMFAAWGIGLPLPLLNLVAAVIYHFVNRRRSRFVAFHSLQSLLSQVPIAAGNAAILAWLVRNLVVSAGFNSEFFVALTFVVLCNVSYVVFSVVGLVHARRGQFYYFPLLGPVVFGRYFGPEAVDLAAAPRHNQPPPGR